VNGVLLIPGYELRAGRGSVLALGIEELPSRSKETKTTVRNVHRMGGVAFLGHLERWSLSELRSHLEAGPDGIEITNLHAVAQQNAVVLTLRGLLLPRPFALRTLARTPWETLERLRVLPQVRALVGGVDAHAKIRVVGPLGGTVDRYGTLFRLLTTHVLVREFTESAILEALRQSRSYVAFESLGRVDRFVFEPQAESFRVEVPAPARIVLICDGVEVASRSTAVADLEIPPGAARCRAEVWKGDRLWVATSSRSAVRPQ
jgi:hypothetical protein